MYRVINGTLVLVARRFVELFGCVRLSVGEAVRKLLDQFPYSELAMQIKMHLTAGETIPDELCVLALERIMMDTQCQTRGLGVIHTFMVYVCPKTGTFWMDGH